jgi:signal transduction histidine kinase
MGLVTIFWSLAAGVALTLAVVSGSVGMAERRDPASLTLAALGVAVAASAYIELRLMHSETPSEYADWVRWYHLPVFVAMLAQVLFVHYYLGTSRVWLLWVVIAGRAIVLAVDFLVLPDFNFASIASLSHVPLLDEQVAIVGSATPRLGWQLFALATTVLLLVYCIDAAVRRWRSGGPESKRKALAIGLGITAPWCWTMAQNQLIVFGLLKEPVSSLPWFLGALIVMTFELTRDYVLSRRALVEVAQLQRRLMQIERVGVLGQLAAALAHQLAQPLSANTANAAVALKQLDRETPDREELRAILADIKSDSHRSAELIASMRQLIRQSAIDMRPVRIEDAVQDALSLVRAEANAKRVALSLLLQPDLPRVLGDRVHLSQVVLNLLMNGIEAVQARPPGERSVVIEARATSGRGLVEMAVRDSGPGVPDGVAEKIFGPFFTTKPEGMGIGLALSRTIIEAHGGRLWMEQSAQPDGATFRFTLQRA